MIKVGYTVSTKGGLTTYRARAFVEDDGVKHTRIVALGDSAEEACGAAVGYIKARYQADDIPMNHVVKNVGKVRGALLDNYLF